MEKQALKFSKGNDVNFNGNNRSKVSRLVLCLRVLLHVSHTFLCSKMSSNFVETSMGGGEFSHVEMI